MSELVYSCSAFYSDLVALNEKKPPFAVELSVLLLVSLVYVSTVSTYTSGAGSIINSWLTMPLIV